VRTDEKDPGVIRFHELQINPADVRVMARGCVVPLRTTEYRQLEFLMRNPERVFSRDQLLRRVWGPDCRANERTVDVTIQRVRKALSRHECDHYVQTVRGVGYRISATVDRRPESTTTPG
jgi:two-component system phosphate regulon response regulator PhoB